MNLLKTPLHAEHVALKARMAEFAGYDMPISYDGTSGGMLKEHLAVRQAAGIFDVSHMGEFWLRGREATRFLSHACTRPFEKLADNKAQYCMLLNAKGTIVDDIIVYRFNAETYWVVVNASNIQKDYEHLAGLTDGFDVTLEDVSENTALIALQGKTAVAIAEKVFPEVLSYKYYGFGQTKQGWLVGRTGYTGEDGFEVFLKPSEAVDLWRELARLGGVPIGLGARDTLRLEVGFSLYGHELSDTLYPLETFSAFAYTQGHPCVGSKVAADARRFTPVALVGTTPKPMRQDEKIIWNNEAVGVITSGSTSPIRKLGIGLGLIDRKKLPTLPPQESIFLLESGQKTREAVLTQTPFVSTSRVKGK